MGNLRRMFAQSAQYLSGLSRASLLPVRASIQENGMFSGAACLGPGENLKYCADPFTKAFLAHD
jgi:hypothetical protein